MFKKYGENMFPLDKNIRDQIIEQKGNIVINASAGTGKTYTTVLKMKKEIKDNKTYKTLAAITFTRKAAEEIKERIGIVNNEEFIGTNDSFVLIEIIQPFMYDVYGKEYKIEIKPSYNTEDVIQNFSDGILKIKTSGLLCKYEDNRKNFPFELAIEILKNSKACKRYLKSKYSKIYIDEYQDCDYDMHKLFMYICDELKIELFIVGDMKQSIYKWRGAYKEGFKKLFESEIFHKFEITHNFRSNQEIQNYSNIFIESEQKKYKKTSFNKQVIIVEYSDQNNLGIYMNKWINKNQKCKLLSYSKDNAEKWANFFISKGLEFKYIPPTPLDDSRIESEHIWIARSIAQYLIKDRYSEVMFFGEIPMPETYKYNEVSKILKSIKSESTEENRRVIIRNIYKYLGYEHNLKMEKEINILFTVINKIGYYEPTYNENKYNLTTGTIHSSKGLEFEQVVINASDYDFQRQEIEELHYVAISRPIEKLFIFLDKNNYNANNYKKKLYQIISEMKEQKYEIEIEDIVTTDKV